VRSALPLSLAGLAALLTFVLAGSAFARQSVRPDRSTTVRALRAAVDHYRSLTWTFERAAHVRRTRTSYSYRRSTDASYLQWTVTVWSHRADSARDRALRRIHRRLAVAIPRAPQAHSRLWSRLSYNRRVALKLRRIYPGSVTRRFASARARTGAATLRLWQERLASATLQVSRYGYARPPIPTYLQAAFLCIHHYEGAWNSNTGNGYYGGLQMDVRFQTLYGRDFVRRWGTADNWPAWAQLQTAVRAYRSGRGFWPWPRTARACGLI
jgi:Transglycosylase-like domain